MHPARPLALLLAPLLAFGVTACASTASSSSFKGEQHAVAQTISNLQADTTAAEQKKVCTDDLAAALVTRLGRTKGCEAAIKSQLTEVDTPELTIQSVKLLGGASATAQVKSTYSGKSRVSTITLVKEAGKWKISGLG